MEEVNFSPGDMGTMVSSLECIVSEIVDFMDDLMVESEIFPSYDPNIFVHAQNGDSGPFNFWIRC